MASLTFDELKTEWAENHESFNESDPGQAVLQTVKSQSYFINQLSIARYELSQMEVQRSILKHDLIEYYMKRETPEIREKLKKTEGFGLKILAKDVAGWVDADPLMVLTNLRIAKQDEKVEWIKNIIAALKDRNWALKDHITWQMFVSGK